MATLSSPVLVDAHVHFYPCFSQEIFLEQAARNFAAAAAKMGRDESTGVLLFTEGAGDHFFRTFRDAAGAPSNGEWSFRSTGEDESLQVLENDVVRMILVAGRQIVAREDLEVLSIGSSTEHPDGRPITETIETVREEGALPIIPWGFGKWWFKRGKLLESLMEAQNPSDFFLGDNSARLKGTPRPELFSRAEARGIRILPGTDPLPFPEQARKAGSFGFCVDAELDREAPAKSLMARLRDRDTKPEPYGDGEGIIPFLKNQVAMQKRKRFGG